MEPQRRPDLRIFGTAGDSIVDGPGLRFAVFVQGCTHSCRGCHNPDSWDAAGGHIVSVDEIMRAVQENPLVRDITISGGEPFNQAAGCAELAKRAKAAGYGVWLYTGYLYEDLLDGKGEAANLNHCDVLNLLKNADVLVDGPFQENLRSLELRWKGSSNQRVIDLNKTREQGQLVLYA